MIINKFDGEFRWLSNFHIIKIEYECVVYPSVEHAYQAAKTDDLDMKILIASNPSPASAKSKGRSLGKPPGWHERSLIVMKDLLRIKFRDPYLRLKLVETGDAELVEGNTWGDRFFGVCNGVGENHLGKLLMEVRSEILKERM